MCEIACTFGFTEATGCGVEAVGGKWDAESAGLSAADKEPSVLGDDTFDITSNRPFFKLSAKR